MKTLLKVWKTHPLCDFSTKRQVVFHRLLKIFPHNSSDKPLCQVGKTLILLPKHKIFPTKCPRISSVSSLSPSPGEKFIRPCVCPHKSRKKGVLSRSRHPFFIPEHLPASGSQPLIFLLFIVIKPLFHPWKIFLLLFCQCQAIMRLYPMTRGALGSARVFPATETEEHWEVSSLCW